VSEKNVALVTGASSGMGKEIAKQLLADGYVVYAAARRVDRMRDLEQLNASVLKMDITREEDVTDVVATIQARNNGVDVLINNAGFGSYGAMEDIPIEDARYQFEVNLMGPARLTQALLPHMRAQQYGKIINISSMGGKIYTPLGSWYHATKHALEGWSDSLRLELSPFGIDVIIIEPGIIETEFGDTVTELLMRRSGQSAYAELANKMKQATQKSYEKGNGSPPAVVAKTISTALKANKPKTRYVVGKMAGPLLFVRKWFGDRLFDRLVRASI